MKRAEGLIRMKVKKGTNQGRNARTGSMNKAKKRTHKEYVGQGR